MDHWRTLRRTSERDSHRSLDRREPGSGSRWPLALLRELRDHGDHVAADTVTGHRELAGIEVEVLAVLGDVRGRRIVLFNRHWKQRLWRGRVVHKDKNGIGAIHQIAQQSVMRLFAAQYPATTAEVHHDRQKTLGAFRPRHANGNLAARTNRKALVFNIGWQLPHFYTISCAC